MTTPHVTGFAKRLQSGKWGIFVGTSASLPVSVLPEDTSEKLANAFADTAALAWMAGHRRATKRFQDAARRIRDLLFDGPMEADDD